MASNTEKSNQLDLSVERCEANYGETLRLFIGFFRTWPLSHCTLKSTTTQNASLILSKREIV